MSISNSMKQILNFILVSFIAVSAMSCDGEGEASTSALTIKLDKTLVQADSDEFVNVEVYNAGNLVTDGIAFYDRKGKTVDIRDGKFFPKTSGVFEFYAMYGGAWSEFVTVRAIDFPVPALPEDTPLPENSAFPKKVLALQFTSTGCVACPNMKKVLKATAEDPDYTDKFILVSSHHDMSGYQYGDDPAGYSGNDAFMSKLGVSSFPTVVVNMATHFMLYQNETLQSVEARFKDEVAAKYGNGLSPVGIAVNSDASDKGVVARVLVKICVASEFAVRVAACLVEDGIEGPQANAPSNDPEWSIHNNCIRMLDCDEKNGYAGYSLGRMQPGVAKEYTFVFDNSSDLVKMQNCKLLFYVTMNGSMQNAFMVPIGEEVGFEYID